MPLNSQHQLLVDATMCPELFQNLPHELIGSTLRDAEIIFEGLKQSCDFSLQEFSSNYGLMAKALEDRTPGKLYITHLFDDRWTSFPEHCAVFLFILKHIHYLHPTPLVVDANYSLTRHARHDASCFFMTCLTGLEARGHVLPREFENHLSFRSRVCEQLLARRNFNILLPCPSTFVGHTWLSAFCALTFPGRVVADLPRHTKLAAYSKFVNELRSPYVGTNSLVWLMASILLNDANFYVKIVMFDEANCTMYGEGNTSLYMCLWGNTFYGMVHNRFLVDDLYFVDDEDDL